MQSIVILIAVIYFVLMIGIGFWANRRMKSAKDYLVAGQSLGFFVMAISSFSSIQSGWGMVGATGTFYAWGFQSLIASGILVPLGFVLAWFLLGTRLRRVAQAHEVYSVPDFIRLRYGSKTAHAVMSIAMLLGSIGYMTSQIAAMGIIMQLLFGLPLATGAWIGALIVTVYTVAGGMLAAVWTDLIQGVLMIVMSLLVFVIAISDAGGWANMLNTLAQGNPHLVSILSVMPVTYILSYAIMICFGAAGQPHLITKFLMLKDEEQLRWGATVAAIAYGLTTLFSVGVAFSMRAMTVSGQVPLIKKVDDTATAFLGNGHLINPVIAGIALTGLLAAIMSSASSYITIGASSIMRDLALAFNVQIKRDLLWGRIYTVVIVLLSLLFGLYLNQIIYLLGAFGWAAFSSASFGPIVLGLYWKRSTGAATATSVLVGILFNLVATILTAKGYIVLPKYLMIGGVSVILGIVVFIIMSYLTKSSEDEDKFANLFA